MCAVSYLMYISLRKVISAVVPRDEDDECGPPCAKRKIMPFREFCEWLPCALRISRRPLVHIASFFVFFLVRTTYWPTVTVLMGISVVQWKYVQKIVCSWFALHVIVLSHLIKWIEWCRFRFVTWMLYGSKQKKKKKVLSLINIFGLKKMNFLIK